MGWGNCKSHDNEHFTNHAIIWEFPFNLCKINFGKLLCSPGLQGQHADLVLPANKITPAHKKLLTSAGLPAQHKN